MKNIFNLFLASLVFIGLGASVYFFYLVFTTSSPTLDPLPVKPPTEPQIEQIDKKVIDPYEYIQDKYGVYKDGRFLFELSRNTSNALVKDNTLFFTAPNYQNDFSLYSLDLKNPNAEPVLIVGDAFVKNKVCEKLLEKLKDYITDREISCEGVTSSYTKELTIFENNIHYKASGYLAPGLIIKITPQNLDTSQPFDILYQDQNYPYILADDGTYFYSVSFGDACVGLEELYQFDYEKLESYGPKLVFGTGEKRWRLGYFSKDKMMVYAEFEIIKEPNQETCGTMVEKAIKGVDFNGNQKTYLSQDNSPTNQFQAVMDTEKEIVYLSDGEKLWALNLDNSELNEIGELEKPKTVTQDEPVTLNLSAVTKTGNICRNHIEYNPKTAKIVSEKSEDCNSCSYDCEDENFESLGLPENFSLKKLPQ